MTRDLFRSTTVFSVNTLFSRILGFARDIIFAHFFGAIAGFDAFLVAFKLPNFMRRLFAEGAFSQAFIPVLSQYRETKTHSEVREFISYIFGGLGATLLLLSLIVILAAPLVTTVFAPGFIHSIRFLLATTMIRITFPYLLLIGLAAACAAVLNCYGSFGIPAFSAVWLNVVLIAMAFIAQRYFKVPVYGLAWGVVIAGVVQLSFLLPFLYFKKLLPRPRLSFSNPGVRRVLFLMVPAIFGVSMVQISILIDTVFASFLKTGSVSWLYYSNRLTEFPLGVFGVAIATVILPKLSRHHIKARSFAYSKTLDWALHLLLLVAPPSSIGLFILSGPLLSTLFQGGKFTPTDVMMARESLMAFSIGILAAMSVKILSSCFYARQNIKTPAKIAAWAVLFNILLNLILIFPLKHAGLALSTSLAAFFNASCLLFLLLKQKIYRPQSQWLKELMRFLIADCVMGMFLFFVVKPLPVWLVQRELWRIGRLSFAVFSAVVIYWFVLFVLRYPFAQLWQREEVWK
ncbi:MAG: murein biosynthesis integral membrane protein MurJ [Pseudomonadota bacterium]